MSMRPHTDRRGFTLVELLIALVLSAVVVTAALTWLREQEKAFSLGDARMKVTGNLRFAVSSLERDLRTAGAGVPGGQPWLVYAGTEAVAFNADYVTSDANDLFAVYNDPAAPPASTTALNAARRITIPRSTFGYPDTSYLDGGGNSEAETIVFYFEPDTSTVRSDDWVLRRKVNDMAPAVVARSILPTPGKPFFQYMAAADTNSAQVDSLPAARLPVQHSVRLHGAATDTGAVATIDRIRAVRVNFTATNGATGAKQQSRVVSRIVRLPNAGIGSITTCGEAPQLGAGFAAARSTPATVDPSVTLTWSPAVDENAGEKDVLRYVVWRKTAAGADWGDPYLSVPAGSAAYIYVDRNVAVGTQYFYALAAQDCTPSISAFATAAPVFP
jgi:prepilin-type N-terminal cleavage/methylation domain-containing protein